MKVCIFGCKSTTQMLARHVSQCLPLSAIVTIGREKAESADVADFFDIHPWAAAQGLKVHTAAQYNLKDRTDEAFFENERFDLGFVIGWQRLIPPNVLRSFSQGVFGMHGSAANLPLGRGRSPMNWALIEGRAAFYTNLFKYDPGVDSGDILDTMCFSINASDTAETLHFKNTLSMVALVRRNAERFRSGAYTLTAQAAKTPTYYPKRTPADSLIDWDMPADALERFIRAVAPPFNGAFSFIGDAKVTITRAAIFEYDCVPLIGPQENGTICEVFPNGKFLVRCSGGTLLAHEYDCADRLVIQPGAAFHANGTPPSQFARNRHGGHDLPEGA